MQHEAGAFGRDVYQSCYRWKGPVARDESREAFLGFIQDASRDNGLYFLDEPEAALSPSRQLTLLYEMDQLAHHGSQLIVATHSPFSWGFQVPASSHSTVASCTKLPTRRPRAIR